MYSQPFSLWQPLGKGVHSVVWRARRKTHDSVKPAEAVLDLAEELSLWVAIKVVQDNRIMPPHDIVREAAILQEISHPNIISFITFILGEPGAPFALYMPLIPLPLTVLLSSPYFTSCSLTGPYSALGRPIFASHASSDGVNPFGIVVKSIIYQLLLAIAFLHSLDPPVAHRDVNPSNVLIDYNGTAKLIDFGIAWSTRHLRTATLQTADLPESSRRHPFDGWTETEEKMCCEVATGPFRAPELLFSPRTYSAIATDLWSLGATIAQFFTPLRLIPSRSPISSPSSAALEEEEDLPRPFSIPPNIKANIDYRATWERLTLFDGNRGELGLAWSIFKLRGTPNEKIWPSFNSLPDANKIEFQITNPKPLHSVLPHLPSSWLPDDAVDNATMADVITPASPLSLIDSLLAYPPMSRLTATKALAHPWFSVDVILPRTPHGSEFGSGQSIQGRNFTRSTKWAGRTLGEWLEPVLRREVAQLTSK